MVNYYLRRVGQFLLVWFLALTISFAMYRLMPGGPVEAVKANLQERIATSGGGMSASQAQQLNRLAESYTGINPDQPIWRAYIEYIVGIVTQADFGTSIWHNEPVFDMLLPAIPWSMFISIYGLALGTTTSLLLGAAMAYKEGSRMDTGLTIFSIVNRSIPYYVVAIFAIIVFAVNLEWFPTGGRMNPNTTPGFNLPFMFGVLHHAALPILSSFVAGFGGALAYRGNCVRVLGEEYLRAARLRGVGQGRLAIRYVGRNALLPIYTGLLMGVAGIFGSGIIIETIFTYPAVGYITFNALENNDYPLLMASFLIFTTITLLGLLIADFTYGMIDPRVETGDNRESFN
ncbi:ABC transporter permease [Halococcus agarilyticus]|uniref:ABC transporter permease n=1 Tax=Halococcus agarilyticus TaxID=1232219 RepID=UPI000677CD30|nr:ABC transporter permease [Halococcus agarilyticus]